jgi:quercetin 2,3-dioxygenase
MAIKIRTAKEHGRTILDWLDSRHGFSFGEYYDRNNMNFGKLIVFNDDLVKAGTGFGSHSHENAEIFSFVIEGALEHKDSKGNHGIIKEYEIQRISAGSGITHSEFNASKENRVHFLQIWFRPRRLNSKPSYEQKSFANLKGNDGIFKLISGKVDKQLVYIDQDAEFYIAHLGKETLNMEIMKGCGLYLYVLEGNLNIGNLSFGKGDSIEITEIKNVEITSQEKSVLAILQVPL